jgi:hypothetical protein
VLAAAVLLLGGVLPVLHQATSERSNRVKCASNMRNIAQHGFIYANQDTRAGQKFPRTYYNPGGGLDKTLKGG